MVPNTIMLLLQSDDPVDRDAGLVLVRWQDEKESVGKERRLGREPHAFGENGPGAVAAIAARVRARAGGFDEVPPEFSFESVVILHRSRFPDDVVDVARDRLLADPRLAAPTASIVDFERRTAVLFMLGEAAPGAAAAMPVKTEAVVYSRSPAVKARVLRIAAGHCQLCAGEAPFIDVNGLPYLEVHHVRPLAVGGRDRFENAAALCPNCHRAVHLAAGAQELTERLYETADHLERE